MRKFITCGDYCHFLLVLPIITALKGGGADPAANKNPTPCGGGGGNPRRGRCGGGAPAVGVARNGGSAAARVRA
jgi:hypothetical protein